MKVHELKTWPQQFAAVNAGIKRWELRRNDRDFETGDLLYLREYNNESDEYTGHHVLAEVLSVMHDFDVPEGLPSGFVIMDIDLRRLVPSAEFA